MSLDTTNHFHAHGPPRAYDTSDHHCTSRKKNSVSTARMKSSKDAAAQVAKRRAIPRLIAKAINLDFALSISLQTNKLPAQHTQSILYLPISNHHLLPKLLKKTYSSVMASRFGSTLDIPEIAGVPFPLLNHHHAVGTFPNPKNARWSAEKTSVWNKKLPQKTTQRQDYLKAMPSNIQEGSDLELQSLLDCKD